MQYRGDIDDNRVIFSKPQIMTMSTIPGFGNYNESNNHNDNVYPMFGKGDLGKRGIRNFVRTHQCNEFCKKLGLESIKSFNINKYFGDTQTTSTYAMSYEPPMPVIDSKHSSFVSNSNYRQGSERDRSMHGRRSHFDPMGAPIMGRKIESDDSEKRKCFCRIL